MAPTAAQVQAVERLVHESVQAVDALTPAAINAVLPALKQARDELAADLTAWFQQHPDGGEAFTAFQKKQALLALESSIARIQAVQPAMAQALGMGRKQTGTLAAKNLEHEVQRLSSIFDGGFVSVPQINVAAIVAQGNKLLWKRHENSAKRYAGSIGDDIRMRMSVSLAKHDTFEQMVQRLRGSSQFRSMVALNDPAATAHGVADSMFHRWRHWADRLVRTENMHAYNVQHDAAIEHVNANRSDDDEEYLRRWDATADRVTCPRCKALDRTLATLKGDFAGGVHSPPLHPYCRCVVLAWLARWGHIKGETPAVETFHDEGEAKRRAKAAEEAKKAAAEELAAFDADKAKAKEWEAKVAAAKAKQAKLAAEIKAKLAAEKAALQAKLEAEALAAQQKLEAEIKAAQAKAEAAAKRAAEKAAADAKRAAEKAAKLAAEQAAAAAKAAAEAAVKAQQEAAEKAAKQAKAQAAKQKKVAKLAATAAPFDPSTSGTIGYIPKGKAKGKEHLLSKPGMVQVDANTIIGHGYHVEWESESGKWVTKSGPVDLGFTYSHGAQKWAPKAAPAPAPTPPAAVLGPKPAPIKGYEWKQVGSQWVLHDMAGTPTSQLVPPLKLKSPMLLDTYSLGADLAKHGLVPTAPGVMEGHGYKFVKDASGTWTKVMAVGQPYTAPNVAPAVTSPAAVQLGKPGDGTQLTERQFSSYRSKFDAQIDAKEKQHILRYSGSSYSSINGALRSGNPQREAESIKYIDRGLAKAVVDQPLLLHRGVYGADMERVFGNLKPGDKFDDAAYVSTSAFEGSSFGGNVKFRVTVPVGFRAGAIPSHFSNEKEFLLPRGTQFEVTGVTKVGGKTVLDVRVVSQPGVTPPP